ncbi:transposase [Candidatus Omnitrophota bacterium]
MGRLPRVYIEGILYYVSARSGHGQNLFVDHSDYKQYLSLIQEYKKQYGFKLFSYVLLPTHMHLLVELRNDISISNIMHDINSLYTKMFNSRYNKKGHVFQARFKTLLTEKETYLLPLMRHIHLNPQRVKSGYDPQDYPYSSYPQFLNAEKRQHPDMREETEEVFSMLKGREEAFIEYIKNPDQSEMHELKKNMHRKSILGSRNFENRIKKIIEEESVKQKRRRPLSKRARIVYVASVGAIILLVTLGINYFYGKRALTLKTEYDKTLVLYESTLESLRGERDKALETKRDIENYQWKIELTKGALEDLKVERQKVVKAKKEIDGYSWKIRLTRLSGSDVSFELTDVISFSDNRVNSENMSKEGFPSVQYSKRESRGNKIVWETIQTNPQGGTVSWRGEWNGKRMKGVLSKRSGQGMKGDFSFVSMGEREGKERETR